jgi:hypothetical protein
LVPWSRTRAPDRPPACTAGISCIKVRPTSQLSGSMSPVSSRASTNSRCCIPTRGTDLRSTSRASSVSPSRSIRLPSNVEGVAKSLIQLNRRSHVESTDGLLSELVLWHSDDHVTVDHRLLRQTLSGPYRHFRADPPNRSRYRSADDSGQHGRGSRARQHANGASYVSIDQRHRRELGSTRGTDCDDPESEQFNPAFHGDFDDA